MRPHLMFRDRDFDPQQELPASAAELTQDLGVDVVVAAMAGKDDFLAKVARQAVLCGGGEIRYRQAVLKDCVKHRHVLEELYRLAVDALEAKRRHFLGLFARSPSSILYESNGLLHDFADVFRRLRAIAELRAGGFESEGFTALFRVLREELTDPYLATVERHLAALKFRDGNLVSVELGDGNEGTHHVLRESLGKGRNWLDRLLGRGPPGLTFQIADRDEAGHRALSELRDRSLNVVANALAQSTDHVVGFFELLRAELAFYIGCVNLHATLTSIGAPLAFPEVGSRFTGLYDVALALRSGRPPVGNGLDVTAKQLVVITGANQGGKSTFLRAAGLAQLMFECGMFVGAESFAGEPSSGVFTHFRREEDAAMKSGKLDEELRRMSDIVDAIHPGAIVLLNESFASTNEREGSEIARQIVRALLEKGVRVLFVTHLYDFARAVYDEQRRDTLFLRAEREPDGTRTYKLLEAPPLETSFGQDLYREVFGAR